eukprot:6191641-Ditylum_brightwellii.AAC.1
MEQLTTQKDDYLVSTPQNLALLDKADVDSILCADKGTFMMRRTLTMVANFIWKGGNLTPNTTI